MPLFLDRLPLYSWVDPRHILPVRRWSVSLPAFVVAAELQTPPENLSPQRWVFDSACSFEACAWRSHLEEAGLNPRIKLAGKAAAYSAFGTREELPIRKAALWLISNIPSLRDKPFRIPLNPGIVFFDRACPRPEIFRPLIGLGALIRSGVTLQINSARTTVSIWTPGTWYQNLWLSLRRPFSRSSTLPLPW